MGQKSRKTLLEKAVASEDTGPTEWTRVSEEEVDLLLALCDGEISKAQAGEALGVSSTARTVRLQRMLWAAVWQGKLKVSRNGR